MSSSARTPAGLGLEAHKARPFERPLLVASPPAVAVLALDQGTGDAARPLVGPGARVRLGSLVARAGGPGSSPLHSPISGVVRGVETRTTLSGPGPCLVIDNDGLEAADPGLTPVEWASLDADALIECIGEAGIVGLGGAAFPTAAKLALARARDVDLLLLNGVECEPWICCDDVLMRTRAADVVLGARVMLAACGARHCTIVLESDKPEAAASLAGVLEATADDRLSLEILPTVYPLGAERQLIESVTGREVPGDALPPAVGVVCQNVGTAAAVAQLVDRGRPLVSRIVTVTGSGVASPANVEVRIGTPIADLIDACGGYRGHPQRLIAGGSMTGRALPSDAIATTKGLNCIIAATSSDLGRRGEEMPCIRCGDCATVCPPGLLPQQLYRAATTDDRAGLERYGLRDCIECGCCDYVCPSHLPLVAGFHDARRRLDLHDAERQRAAEARRRFERHERRREEQAAAERQSFEAARRRARDAGQE